MGLTMPCMLHKFHRPAVLSTDEHHIEPQSWQKFATGGKLDNLKLVTLCPTSHRNVHFYIVSMMKWIRLTGVDDHEKAFKSLNLKSKETEIAHQALIFYSGRGRSLLELARSGNLGQS